jgi:hypothetical protein
MHAVFWWGERLRLLWEADIQMDLKERNGMKWNDLAQNREGDLELRNLCPIKFLDWLMNGDSFLWS